MVLVGGLLLGCVLVLLPFLTAILFAAVIAISTWPLYQRVVIRFKGRRSLASLVCCFGVVMVLVGPTAILAVSAADAAKELFSRADAIFTPQALAPPSWVVNLPVVGGSLDQYWRGVVANREEQARLFSQISSPVKDWAVEAGSAVIKSVLNLVTAIFLLFFIYRDGHRMGRRAGEAAERIAGPTARELITVGQNTVIGVMLGLVATAVAQGLVAALGFIIAGVPGPMLLGAATFALSFLPFGPPIIWGAAAVWLYASAGETGWAIFMALYGALVISSVDNVMKPLLIARNSSLPLAMTLLGVLGGVVAFGFMGIFIGPTLLAVTINLADRWLARQENPETSPVTDAEAVALGNAEPPAAPSLSHAAAAELKGEP